MREVATSPGPTTQSCVCRDFLIVAEKCGQRAELLSAFLVSIESARGLTGDFGRAGHMNRTGHAGGRTGCRAVDWRDKDARSAAQMAVANCTPSTPSLQRSSLPCPCFLAVSRA